MVELRTHIEFIEMTLAHASHEINRASVLDRFCYDHLSEALDYVLKAVNVIAKAKSCCVLAFPVHALAAIEREVQKKGGD